MEPSKRHSLISLLFILNSSFSNSLNSLHFGTFWIWCLFAITVVLALFCFSGTWRAFYSVPEPQTHGMVAAWNELIWISVFWTEYPLWQRFKKKHINWEVVSKYNPNFKTSKFLSRWKYDKSVTFHASVTLKLYATIQGVKTTWILLLDKNKWSKVKKRKQTKYFYNYYYCRWQFSIFHDFDKCL